MTKQSTLEEFPASQNKRTQTSKKKFSWVKTPVTKTRESLILAKMEKLPKIRGCVSTSQLGFLIAEILAACQVIPPSCLRKAPASLARKRSPSCWEPLGTTQLRLRFINIQHHPIFQWSNGLQVNTIMAEVEVDHNGKINLSQFILLMHNQVRLKSRAQNPPKNGWTPIPMAGWTHRHHGGDQDCLQVEHINDSSALKASNQN